MPIGTILAAVAPAVIGGIMGNDAADTQAQTQRDIAASQTFKPYGVSTPFGSSSFTTAEQADFNKRIMQQLGLQETQLADGSFGFTASARKPNPNYIGTRAWDAIDPATGKVIPNEQFTSDPELEALMKQLGVSEGQSFNTRAQATATRSQPIQQGTQAALALGNSQLGKVQSLADMNPETLANSQFQRYLQFVQPTRAAELDKTLGGLSLSGNLGYLNNNTGTNPVLQSLAKGNADSDQDVFLKFLQNARDNKTQDVNQALKLGQSGFGTAGQIDALASNTIDQGAALGGRAGVQANAAAGTLLQAANTTANNSMQNAANITSLLGAGNKDMQSVIQNLFKTNAPSTPNFGNTLSTSESGWTSGFDLG